MPSGKRSAVPAASPARGKRSGRNGGDAAATEEVQHTARSKAKPAVQEEKQEEAAERLKPAVLPRSDSEDDGVAVKRARGNSDMRVDAERRRCNVLLIWITKGALEF